MPSRDVNAATRLAEASWRRDKLPKSDTKMYHLILKRYHLEFQGDFTELLRDINNFQSDITSTLFIPW